VPTAFQIAALQLPVAFDVNVHAAACTFGAGSMKHMLTAKANITMIDKNLDFIFSVLLFP
jgi:hypothetical protein